MPEAKTRAAPPLVILLHGVAARGADLAWLQAELAAALPEARVIAPDAPFAHDEGGEGRQWYSLAGVTPRNRRTRVRAARSAFDTLISGLIAAHGQTGRLDRVALVGFSQGATMAFDAVASGRWAVGGLVTFACRVATAAPLTPNPATPILMVHGLEDMAVPARDSEQAWDALRRAGHAADFIACSRTGHEITPAAAAYAGRFLARCLA